MITNATSDGVESDNSSAIIKEELEFYVCGYVDFPSSGIDCSTRNSSVCFTCMYQNVYFSGESINDFQSSGHITCRIISVLIALVGISGVITNGLIIKIIQKKRSRRSFDFLVCALSLVDIFCCLGCISYSCAHVAYYDSLFDRGMGTMYAILHSGTTIMLWRCMSMYLTTIITMERYFAIACPLRSRAWYSLGKTKLQIAFVAFFVSLIILPAFCRIYIGPNIYGNQDGGLDVPSLRDFKYMFRPATLYSLFQFNYDILVGIVYLFQYWIPVPALFVFNFLTYKKIKQLSKQRQLLTVSQQNELQPAKMFLPVVVVFLCTNMWPMVMLFTLKTWGVFFKEIWMSVLLATAVNSAVNFWIYYFRGSGFRVEAKSLFSSVPTSLSFISSARKE